MAYAGSHGYHEMLSLDANEPFPTFCPASPCPSGLAAGTIYYPTGAALANPNLANTTTWVSEGLSSYNALQVDVNRRFTHGLQFRGVYTFSKSLDDGTAWNSSVGANAPGFVMYPLNPKLDWGPSTTDVRNLAAINATYELPLARASACCANTRGWREELAERVDCSAIETLQSGLPVHSAVGLQPHQQRRQPRSGAPRMEPGLHRQCDRRRPEPVFQSQCLSRANHRYLRQCGPRHAGGTRIAELDFSILKNRPR